MEWELYDSDFLGLDTSVDLVQYAEDNMELFPVDKRGFYHNMISLIISQRVRFTVGRAIRRRIYALQNTNSLDRVTELTETERVKVKLPPNKWEVIMAFHDKWTEAEAAGGNVDPVYYSTIKGIGPWTVQCAKIMAGDYSTRFITTDLAVRKWVSSFLKLKRTMKQGSLRYYIDSLKLSLSDESKLFSRIWNYTRSL